MKLLSSAALGGLMLCVSPLALAAAPALPPDNPLAKPTPLPYEAPPWDKLKDGDFKPALEAGMAEEDAEIEAIADNPAPPSFDNTIVAMQKSGTLLNRASFLFHHLAQANTDDVLDKVNEEETPRLQAHEDAIRLNAKLFQRIKTLHDQGDALKLSAADRFLLDKIYSDFVLAGALLGPQDQAVLRKLNERLATLSTGFRTKLQAVAAAAGVVVDSKAELAGLNDAQIAAAAEAAKARKLDGKYLLVLRNTTQQPLLAQLENRALRQRLLAASEARGSQPGEHDLRDVIATEAQLRAQKAKLLGFPSEAAYVLSDQMAKTPDQALKLLRDLVPATVAKAKQEAAELQAEIDKEKGGFQLTAADWQFYAEKVKKAKYAFDEAEVKPYFVLDKVLEDGVFFAANQLYGFTFKRRTDIPVYQPDVRVYEVFDADGKPLALFYGDYYARPNKDGGAWCEVLNQPSRMAGKLPVVVNVLNLAKPEPGKPALISAADVTAMFHEFGHAIHGMVSVHEYPEQGGFNVPTDVVEFPSQFNEHWAFDPTVLAHYAHHYQTGQTIPDALVAKIKRAHSYGQGYAFAEVLEASLLDLDWHSLGADAPKQDPAQFEAAALKKEGFGEIPQVPSRYHSPYFLHIWANGYEANYYSYTWGAILDDDAFEWFQAHGGLTRENGQRFRDRMLGPTHTADPMALYRDFRGGDPTVDALKRDRGLIE